MKRTILFLLCTAFLACSLSAQPGRFAGSYKSWIGRMYKPDSLALKKWKHLEGTMISGINDPEWFFADILMKGTTGLVIFTVREDTAVEEYKIIDVVAVAGMQKGQALRTGVCRENKTENAAIVALIQSRYQPYNKASKAWRLNRDKRRAEAVRAATVDCIYEGYGE